MKILFAFFYTFTMLVILTNCEAVDQAGHYAWGYNKSCVSIQGAEDDPLAVIETVMDYAKAREERQHPGQCGLGCQRDLHSWRNGAEAGLDCNINQKISEKPYGT